MQGTSVKVTDGRGRSTVVLVSGGLDSAVVLACAKRDGFEAHALTIDYGQRHACELDAAARVARSLGASSHRVLRLDLRAIGGSALTADVDVPKHDSADQIGAGIPVTYVPARNLVFLSIALGLAETVGATALHLGVNALDYSGYPDCRPEFIDAFARTARLATKAGVEGGAFEVVAPVMELSKAEIVRLGTGLGVDFSITHSCYDPDASGGACGRCDSCLLRKRGFEEAGVPDPTRYGAGAGAGAKA